MPEKVVGGRGREEFRPRPICKEKEKEKYNKKNPDRTDDPQASILIFY